MYLNMCDSQLWAITKHMTYTIVTVEAAAQGLGVLLVDHKYRHELFMAMFPPLVVTSVVAV